MRIDLIGYMYSGKTTVGHKLTVRTGYQWLDLDQLFEYTYHTSIPIFFKRYGEDAFRKLEQKILHSTADIDNVVISTGGGTPCHFNNMEWINSHGTSVYFDVSIETLLRRADASKKARPTFAGMSNEERKTFIREQLTQRLPYYRKAKIIFPADDPDINQLAKLCSLPLDAVQTA